MAKTRKWFLVAWMCVICETGVSTAQDWDYVTMPRPLSLAGLRVEKRNYPLFRAAEWQVRLQAPDAGTSPVYEDVKSADFVVPLWSDREISVHWSQGSHAEPADFRPLTERLTIGKPFVMQSFGGRSSDGMMPYANVAGADGGLILAVGWPGDWSASFEAIAGGKVRITAGLKTGHARFTLRNGENVRLPSILVMSYQGDWLAGQNQFRRLMLRRFTPTNHKPMQLMPVAASVHGMIGFNDTTETNLVALAADIAACKLPLDTFWLDAGWNEGGFPAAQGNPQADPKRFPRGLAPVGNAAKQASMRFLVWFEPERAMRGTRLDREHPDWLLKPANTPPPLRYMENDGFRLVDLGNPAALQWSVENVSRHIREGNIAIYRQDFNQYPAYFWRGDEKPDALGLREIRYVGGLYDFLDSLARKHPNLILDNCASGGRRLDFEMMRRCVALWRSDSCWDDPAYPRNVQAMSHGLSLWTPLHGLGATKTDDVSLRSGMGACASFAIDFRNKAAVSALRVHLERYLKVRHLFTADYYPLTDWSLDPDQWLAFQYHDPETGEGLIQAFHGPKVDRPARLKLRGLDPDREYVLTDWDQPTKPVTLRGKELITAGFEVRPAGGRLSGAPVFQYVRK